MRVLLSFMALLALAASVSCLQSSSPEAETSPALRGGNWPQPPYAVPRVFDCYDDTLEIMIWENYNEVDSDSLYRACRTIFYWDTDEFELVSTADSIDPFQGPYDDTQTWDRWRTWYIPNFDAYEVWHHQSGPPEEEDCFQSASPQASCKIKLVKIDPGVGTAEIWTDRVSSNHSWCELYEWSPATCETISVSTATCPSGEGEGPP